MINTRGFIRVLFVEKYAWYEFSLQLKDVKIEYIFIFMVGSLKWKNQPSLNFKDRLEIYIQFS